MEERCSHHRTFVNSLKCSSGSIEDRKVGSSLITLNVSHIARSSAVNIEKIGFILPFLRVNFINDNEILKAHR